MNDGAAVEMPRRAKFPVGTYHGQEGVAKYLKHSRAGGPKAAANRNDLSLQETAFRRILLTKCFTASLKRLLRYAQTFVARLYSIMPPGVHPLKAVADASAGEFAFESLPPY